MISTDTSPTERPTSGHKYYGANHSPIANHGGQRVKGETNEQANLTLDFDVADVSRPLLSVTEIGSKKRHRVICDDPVSFVGGTR